jgi:riboflavin biosynthesis pyrimidine reductase
MRRLLPDPGETTVPEQLGTYEPAEEAPEERPFLAMNFVGTLDGRATIDGRSGPIGSSTDTEMMSGLRERFDAVMIGAGTKRVERYAGLEKRLVVVRSGEGEWADLGELLASLRADGVRSVMCEGGPTLHASLQAEGLVDELFLTIAPKLSGGAGPSILEGALPEVVEMELVWLLEEDGELFARYRRS